MRPFSTFLVCFFLLLLIFYFYCFRSHLYILFFSLCFCNTQGWAVLPRCKQMDCLKALCLHKSAISNQGVCKQKELTISQGAANKDIFGLSSCTNFISTGIAVSRKPRLFMDCRMWLLCSLHPFPAWIQDKRRVSGWEGGDILCHTVQLPPICALHVLPCQVPSPTSFCVSSYCASWIFCLVTCPVT